MPTTIEQVGVLLDLAGIVPSESELRELVASFPELRARAERLWALDLADAAPALVFRAGEVTGSGGAARD